SPAPGSHRLFADRSGNAGDQRHGVGPSPPPVGLATSFGSALEGNKAPESRIREAVLSGFDVTSKSVFESWVSGHRHDEVVPAIELVQRQIVYQRRVGVENPRAQVAGIGIEYADFALVTGDIGDFQLD